jgi:D-methionine transport system permease protein
MMKNAKKTLLLLLVVLAIAPLFSSFIGAQGETSEETLSAAEKIVLIVKGRKGTIKGAKDLMGSGQLTSVELENEFVFSISNKSGQDVKLSYVVDGEEVPFPQGGTEFTYKCKDAEDYKSFTVKVSDKEGALIKTFDVSLQYGKLGFFEKLYWEFIEYLDLETLKSVAKNEIPKAVWETFYVTVLATALSIVVGMPFGVLLVVGDKNGIHPMPGWLMTFLNGAINILRSVPFLILMILVAPLSRFIIGVSYGTLATVVPLVFAAFPFIARLVEGSLREVNPNIIEAAQSMGASPMQIILKVMIPESVPSLISNITIALTTILGYSAMSGVIGGGGLGAIAINYGQYRYNYSVMVLTVALLVAMVQVFQSVGTWLAVKSDKRLK